MCIYKKGGPAGSKAKGSSAMMLSKTVIRSFPFLHALYHAETTDAQVFNNVLTNVIVLRSIIEISRNLVEKNIPISRHLRKRLLMYTETLSRLATKGNYTAKLRLLRTPHGRKVLKLILKACFKKVECCLKDSK